MYVHAYTYVVKRAKIDSLSRLVLVSRRAQSLGQQETLLSTTLFLGSLLLGPHSTPQDGPRVSSQLSARVCGCLRRSLSLCDLPLPLQVPTHRPSGDEGFFFLFLKPLTVSDLSSCVQSACSLRLSVRDTKRREVSRSSSQTDLSLCMSLSLALSIDFFFLFLWEGQLVRRSVSSGTLLSVEFCTCVHVFLFLPRRM